MKVESSAKKNVTPASQTAEQKIELRNPVVAGILAWLLPGAGHWYQKRYFKAALFALSIWPVLIAGLFIGTYVEESPDDPAVRQVNFARTVYCSWRPDDKRLYFIPQACVGCVALPAIMQAKAKRDADGSFGSTAFAPPRVASEFQSRPNQPDLNDIIRHLYSWFDLSTIYTVVAGLLNLFVIFDAIGGPAPDVEEQEKKAKEEKSKENKEEK